jgi:hypothetical protein
MSRTNLSMPPNAVCGGESSAVRLLGDPVDLSSLDRHVMWRDMEALMGSTAVMGCWQRLAGVCAWFERYVHIARQH